MQATEILKTLEDIDAVREAIPLVRCDNTNCRYANLTDGTCCALNVQLCTEEGDWMNCLTYNDDCSGLDGYEEPYWTIHPSSNGNGEKVRRRKLGRSIQIGEYTVYTSQRNPECVTEGRTGYLVELERIKACAEGKDSRVANALKAQPDISEYPIEQGEDE